MKVVDAIAHAMKAEGVDTLFAYPVNPLIEAAAEIDIRTIIVRQERIGLHMADAYSRMSSGNKIGVFCMQHGPGAENAFGGVAQAYSESVPILVVPAGYPRRLAHYYPNFNSTLNMQHITKWAEPITMGKAAPETLRRAFFQLRNGRPGPVLLEVPMDVFGEEVSQYIEAALDPASLKSPYLERLSFKKLAGGRKKGEENIKSHYRKGVHGDWKNHLNDDHVAFFKEHYNELLIKLGYETDGDW